MFLQVCRTSSPATTDRQEKEKREKGGKGRGCGIEDKSYCILTAAPDESFQSFSIDTI